MLAPGELGELVLLAKSKDQAKRLFRFIKGIFSTVPRLTPFVEGMSNDELTLTSDVEIIVAAGVMPPALAGRQALLCATGWPWARRRAIADPRPET